MPDDRETRLADVGITWKNHVPANASFPDAALQISNVVACSKPRNFRSCSW